MRALLLLIALSALATPAQAQSRQVIGYAGVLGEWELTATVTENSSRRSKEFSGPLKMKHTGVCTQDGPEEKSGELRFQLSLIPVDGDIAGGRRRMHLQRKVVRLLYRHDELPGPKRGSASEPIQEEWIHEHWFDRVRRLSMMRIMARRTKAATVLV